MDIDKDQYGKRIAFVRRQRGLSQESLADKIGYSRKYISKLESETGKPNYDILKKISEELNCKSDFILGLTDQFERYTYADAMTDYIRELKPDQQRHCIRIVRREAEEFREENLLHNARPLSSRKDILEGLY